MKKRILATLLVGAIAGTSLIGLTACGGVSLPKGDEIDAEKWAEAFEKTGELENYTLKHSSSYNVSGDGKIYLSETKTTDFSHKSKASVNETLLYDLKGQKAYGESKTSAEISTQAYGLKDYEKSKSSLVAKTYYELKETKNETDYFWNVTYTKAKSNNVDTEYRSNNVKGTSEFSWYASTTRYFYSPEFDALSGRFYKDSEGEEGGYLPTLYESFKFESGVYTASLYQKVDLYEGIRTIVPVTVSVSISKADTCVLGVKLVYDASGTAKEEGEYDITYKYKGEEVFALSNVGSTDASKKATSAVKKAIEREKTLEAATK